MFKTFNHNYQQMIFRAPADLGGGPGSEQDDQFDAIPDSDADNENGDDDGEGDGEYDEEEEEITGDASKFMRELFKAGGDSDNGGDEDEGESPEQMAAAEQAMATELQNSLNNLTLPEDIIPEDFDASDPKQLRALLNQVQINAATQAVKLTLRPVQATLGRVMTTVRREMKDTVRNGTDAMQETGALAEAFPGIENPVVAPVIKMLYSQAKAKYPGNRKAAFAAVRKGLQAVGVDGSDTGKSGRRTSEDSAGIKTGNSALDSFGLVIPKANRPKHNRLRGGK